MSDYFTGSDWSQTYAKKALPILVSLAESHRRPLIRNSRNFFWETRGMGIP